MRWLVILGLLAMVVASMPAAADMDTSVHGEVRMRAENVENYYDFDDSDSGDSFSFAPFRVRLGVGVTFGDKVYGYASIQEGDVFGQDDPIQGDDGNLNETDDGNGELVLYQGYVKMMNVGGTSLDLKFGRQEYVQGNEFLFGDLDFYNGVSHDGVRARWDLELGPLDVVWFRSVEDLMGDMDTDTLGVNWNLTDIIPDGELEFYAYYTDSSPNWGGDDIHLEVATIGARAGQSHVGEKGVIWSAEVVAQFGDADCVEQFAFCGEIGVGPDDTADVSTMGFEGMVGYNLNTDHGDHQFFATLYYTSGDDDEDDDEVGDFYAPFQDFHRRNGAADVVSGAHNLTSFSIGWDWQAEHHGVRVEIFSFTASEDGEGSNESYVDVMSDSGLPGDFDYISIYEDDDLGEEIDIIYTYQVNEYFGFEAGVAMFSPGDAIEYYFGNDDNITRLWGQARLRF